MRILLSLPLLLALAAGCDLDPADPADTDAADLFEYDSKPTGDPSVETYRPEHPEGAGIEVPVGERPREQDRPNIQK